MSLLTKREHSLISSGLKKSSFLQSMLLLNFLIRWSWNILYLFNISMMLNKWIIWWSWVDVTTFVELSWRVGDGVDRHHDQIWIDVGLVLKEVLPDSAGVVVVLFDHRSVGRSGFVWLEAPLILLSMIHLLISVGFQN